MVEEYMQWDSIEVNIEMNVGEWNFTAYTCDLTKKYVEINSDYRT